MSAVAESMRGLRLALPLLLALAACASPPDGDAPAGAHPAEEVGAEPAPPRSPEEALAAFRVAPGYRVELVAAEPLVEAPVAMQFDEDGRLWVVEMRGFMPDVDGTGEERPTGRVAVLEDLDGDGRMDRRTTFLDSLVLPRAIALTRGGALVADHERLYFVRDEDGDGRADEVRVVDPDYAPGGNPEHDANGLLRGLDNWYYNAKSAARHRWRGDALAREETEFRGQWGISQDDFGRLFYNFNFSQLHADLAPPGYLTRNPHHRPASGLGESLSASQRVYPLRPNPAVNRGYLPGALDAEGRLLEFTSAGAPHVYRGDALPEEARGNAFVCEPAGNLVKRNLLVGEGLDLAASFAHEDREFLASTDERFRPVFLADGPDGALYVADMYRGLIQHRVALTPYLREQTLERGLEAPLHAGRIWRVVADGPAAPRRRVEPLSRASAERLVEVMGDSNGWRRDVAQRLLVERGAREAIPALRAAALGHPDPRARAHALWTLEGLDDPRPADLLPALDDPHPRVRAAAIRVIERLSAGDAALRGRLLARLAAAAGAADPEVRLQAVLTAGNLDGEGRLALLHGAAARDAARPVFREAVLSGVRDGEALALLRRLHADPAWREERLERAALVESLAGLVLHRGDPAGAEALLDLLAPEGPAADWRTRAVLAAVEMRAAQRGSGPIALRREPAPLRAAGGAAAAGAAGLEPLLRAFRWPGHAPPGAAAPGARPLDEAEAALFARGRQVHLTVCAGCHGAEGEGERPLAPPLAGSEWVVGAEEPLIRILLHGVSGPMTVAGRRYAPPEVLPEMPPMRGLDNQDLAAVLTYIRRAWGHAAEPVAPARVARVRLLTQGRTTPWTEAELLRTTETDGEPPPAPATPARGEERARS